MKGDGSIGSAWGARQATEIVIDVRGRICPPLDYLLYGKQGQLTAQPFDARTLKMTGDPVGLADEPSVVLDPTISYTAGPVVSVAANGSLAYYSTPSQNTVAEWYDLTGRRTGTLPLPTGHYDTIRVSPDGSQAVAVRSISPSESSLWLVDLARGGAVLLTNAPGRNDQPVWSPDGTRILFGSDRDGASDIFVKAVGDASSEQPFFRSPAIFKNATTWSPDGKWIVMTQLDPRTAQDAYLLPAEGVRPEAREPKLLLGGPKRDTGGPVSPDGHWLAYYSDETGRLQLYVQPFPEGGRRVQVSQDGSSGAAWSRDGREIKFIGDDGRTMWRVDVTIGAKFTSGAPIRLGQLPAGLVSLALMPDGQRILAVAPERTGPGSLTVVQHWRAALATRQ
jgi:Tol biopolymer transport system component